MSRPQVIQESIDKVYDIMAENDLNWLLEEHIDIIIDYVERLEEVCNGL